MTRKNILLITCVIVSLSINAVYSQENFNKVAQGGMQYLKIGVGAEMVGRGEAGISLIKGVPSMFWNPAGLAELTYSEFFFSHNSWIADISLNAFGAGINLNEWGVLGINVLWMDYGELRKTSVASTLTESAKYGYVDEGVFSPSDIAIGFTYSKKISPQFAFGAQLKYLYENYGSNVTINASGEKSVTNNILSAFCFDFGTLYYPGIKSLAIAMAVQNFSTNLKYEQESFSTPLTFKIGVSMNLLDLLYEKSNNSLFVAIDAIHPRDYSERLNLGLEYGYLGLFHVRCGYRMNYDIANFTAGAGVRYSISNNIGLKLDFSYMAENTNRLTSPLQISASLFMQ